jgi:DNA excision repair protein ERCC-2
MDASSPSEPIAATGDASPYRVAVKALCQFTAKAGDLDRRFTPAPTGRQGMAGHALVASRRGPEYQTEVSLRVRAGVLEVRGRADGYLPPSQRLEECKTHRGPIDKVPENHRSLHWAQLQTYGALLCQRDALQELQLALVYFDIQSQEETVLEETYSAPALADLFAARCQAFAAWVAQELRHAAQRDASLRSLQFPFGVLHAQQRVLAEAVYRSAASGGALLAEAPTGVGKTLGTLFPMLKAVAARKIEKIFYLTAKSTGRALALDAVAQLRSANPHLTLRVLDFVARDKACTQPGKLCQGDSCPLARGFYDRLPAARAAALGCEVMNQASLQAVARAHEICPYYLSQEMVRWADLVIADYNYYFDSSAMLYGLVIENEWRVGVLVDEAHNLVPRARQMYSVTLAMQTLRAALLAAPLALQPALRRIERAWRPLSADRREAWATLQELPDELLQAVRKAVSELADWLAAQSPGPATALLDFHFAALDFLRLAEAFADHSILDSCAEAEGSETLNFRNIVPASFLASRFAAAHAAVLFSATLSPQEYFLDMLGLRDKARCLVVGSPFESEQLAVRVVADVSTRFRERARSMAAIVSLVGAQFAARPGNYLLFAGSFNYLAQIRVQLQQRFPGIPLWSQTPGMSEVERGEFAARFVADGMGIGLAVLGGAFGEGIDLPGTRLFGAFVLTLGLPVVSVLNEEIRRRLQASNGRGYEYTYLYPGLQRVVQAAGRVIRSKSDRGALFLIDDRYARPEVARMLPSWWSIRIVSARAI